MKLRFLNWICEEMNNVKCLRIIANIVTFSSYIFYTIKVIFIALSCIKPCMFRKSRQNGVMKGDSFEKDVDLRKMLKIEKKLK